MKLTIDTRDDSPEDIRKAIKMLQSLVGDIQDAPRPSPEPVSNGDLNNLMNMFDSNSTSLDEPARPAEKEETDKDDIGVQFY